MKKKWWIPLLGIMLLVGVLVTMETELSAKNLESYERAVALEETLETGFPEFSFEATPMRFFDGDVDYVKQADGFKRVPSATRAFAATALAIDGEMQLIVPTMEKMEGLFALLAPEGFTYDEVHQVATMWHEAFHVYQLTRYDAQLQPLMVDGLEERIAEIDQNQRAVELFTQAQKALYRAYRKHSEEELQTYLNLMEERDDLLTEEQRRAEHFYEMAEGTANYVESIAAIALDESKSDYYFEETDNAMKGTAKYYDTGKIMCYILDERMPDWKEHYDFSKPLRTVLKETVIP